MTNNDIVERSDDLDRDLMGSDLNESVHNLVVYGRRNRNLIKLVFISIAFEFAILSGLIFALYKQNQTQNDTIKNHQSLVEGCRSGNEFREDNRVLWQYVLNVPPATPPTPERQKVIADFEKFLNTTFAPRDCDELEDKIQNHED